jgi:ABC-type lipoprotein release transport system permease subunit
MSADLAADVRYSLRSLVRTPVWTSALVLTIALGIGSSASVQGFVRGLVTTDLPIFAIERVVTVFATDTSGSSGPVPFEIFTALKNQTNVFESLGAIRETQDRVSIGARSTLMSMAAYTRDVAAVLPLPSAPGAALSHAVRFAQFPAGANPAGAPIQIGRRRMTIAGATPYWLEGLYRGRAIDVWLPVDETDLVAGSAEVWLLGRLRPGVSADEAQAAIDASLMAASRNDLAIVALPYTGQTPEVASGMLRVSALLRAAAIAVFLIAAANVAAFVLARSWARARETAVRVAIGARRRQLLRQLLIDSAVISIIGGAAGFVLATWMADIVPLMFFDQDADRLVFAPDARGILLTSILCIMVTIACGLAPLSETRDDEPSAVLQREIAGRSKTMTRISTGLILLQMAACSLLVISTGLLLHGFRAALETQAGRNLGNPVLVTLEASPSPAPDQGRKYYADAIAAAASVATISETVWAARLPGLRPAWQWVRFDVPPADRREMSMRIEALNERALERLSLPPVSGRLFGAFDAGECGAIVLNEAAARAMFDGHPIGRVIDIPNGRTVEVIGVARPKDSRVVPQPAAYDHPAASVPLGLDGEVTFLAPPAAELESGLLDINLVSANYFDVMGLTLQAGELFEGRGRGCRIGVVNEEAAARYFGGNAVGGAVIDANGRRTEIVGVVRSALLRSAQRLVEPALFLPVTQDYLPRMTAILAMSTARERTLEAIREKIAAVPGGRADRLVVTTLDDHLSNTSLAPERIATTLVGTFAVIAIALGALGLYGLMADAARRRQREFAMRLALGAQGWRVVRLVMSEGMRLVAIGVTIGMLGSLLVARWLAAIVPSAGWPSPAIWIAPVVLLAGAVGLASVIPARRALSADLVSLMRDM